MDPAEEIKKIIAKALKLDPATLSLDSSLSDFAADSLDAIEIVFMLEEKYNINLVMKAKDERFVVDVDRQGVVETVDFNTVGDVIRIVEQLVQAKAA